MNFYKDFIQKNINNFKNDVKGLLNKHLLEALTKIDEDVEILESTNLNEAMVRKVVIRKGKRIKRKFSTRKNAKIKDGREVLMKSSEKLKRKKAAKRGAIKRKAKKSIINRKRNKSIKKRKNMNL